MRAGIIRKVQTMKKAALITGSSRGIGRAIALRMADDMPVVLNCRSDIGAAEEVLQMIKNNGGDAIVVSADVSKHGDVCQMFRTIKESGYWVHTLINNAGIARDQLLPMMKIEDWQAVLDCNLSSAFYCAKESASTMITRRGGIIINVSSVAGLHGQVGQTNYASAKAGMIGLTKSLAKELGRHNIRVNCVAPGFVQTDMIDALQKNEKAKSWLEFAVKEMIPLKRIGEPKDIAELVHFLASAKASYMTGQILEVDGGLCM
jgi:3-oxoacyl-[acyl-carrier protein] reductase